MGKIGILTLNGGTNYGNKLQNYALQKALGSLGYEGVTLINDVAQGFDGVTGQAPRLKGPARYINSLRSRLHYRYHLKNSRHGLLSNLIYALSHKDQLEQSRQARKSSFASFSAQELAVEPEPVNNQAATRVDLSTYAAFVAGSDQIWNPNYQFTSAVSFLQFAPKGKRIAYAPSFGVAQIPQSLQAQYKTFLSQIPHLCAREERGAALIQELTGTTPPVVLDPTLLLTAEQWIQMETKPACMPKKAYILTYFLGDITREYWHSLRQLATKLNCEIVNMLDIRQPAYYAIDPAEFVYLLRHAKHICTDSFHGTAFSILFEKEFTVFARRDEDENMNSRFESLFHQLDIHGRYYGEEPAGKLAYPAILQKLQTLREASFRYLSEALQEVDFNEQPEPPKMAAAKSCTGCGACAAVCPAHCITMQCDNEGFYKPVKEQNGCTKCGLCDRICPVTNPVHLHNEVRAYAVKAVDDSLRAKSSSGGVFPVIAQTVLEQGGVVYGVTLNEDMQAIQCRIEDTSQLLALQGSKYVQSNTLDCYAQVRRDLKAGKTVLYTGTPCQVAGLLRYIGKERTGQLFTADLICHGVSSPAAWRAYLDAMEQRYGSKVVQASFRDKTEGWKRFSMYLRFENGQEYRKPLDEDPYLKCFLANLTLNTACGECAFKSPRRESDLTLADFWGLEQLLPQWADDKGVSLVLVHTPRGQELLQAAGSLLTFEKMQLAPALAKNTAAEKSVCLHSKRGQFFAGLGQVPFDRLVQQCMVKPLRRRIQSKLKRWIGK